MTLAVERERYDRFRQERNREDNWSNHTQTVVCPCFPRLGPRVRGDDELKQV